MSWNKQLFTKDKLYQSPKIQPPPFEMEARNYYKYKSDVEYDLYPKKSMNTLPSPTETVGHSPFARIDTFYADSTITSAIKDEFADDLTDNLDVQSDSTLSKFDETRKQSELQYTESLIELLDELGHRYPKWKNERFGLLRFYCHKFNISRAGMARECYTRILGQFTGDNPLLNLLTMERQSDTAINGIYSRNEAIDMMLCQLDEIASCFCSSGCAWYMFKDGPHLCTKAHENKGDSTMMDECFLSSKAKGTGMMEYFSERGVVHCFSRPYMNGMTTELTTSFSRAVTCINCGKLCRCSCSRCIFRSFRDSDDTSEMEVASMDYLNSIGEEFPIRNNKRALEVSVAISHGIKSPHGVIQCLTNSKHEPSTNRSNFGAHSQHLFKLTLPRCGVEDVFSILSTNVDSIVPGITPSALEEWKSVPRHRSWRRCWWSRCDVNVNEGDKAVDDYVTRTLEQLDAFGNIRYDKSLKIIGVGYIQKRNRSCSYWHYFYISELGLWNCFTSAVEFFLLVTAMPLEISLDVKSMHWTVCKCHQGVMHRKSFSTGKHGLLRGYSLAVQWLEGVLRKIGLSSEVYSDFGDEEDLGRSELLESLCVDDNTPINECTISDVLLIAKRRKEILLRENLSNVTRTPSITSSSIKKLTSTPSNTTLTFKKLPLDTLDNLLPDFQKNTNGLLHRITAQYPELREYYNRIINAFTQSENALISHKVAANLVFENEDTNHRTNGVASRHLVPSLYVTKTASNGSLESDINGNTGNSDTIGSMKPSQGETKKRNFQEKANRPKTNGINGIDHYLFSDSSSVDEDLLPSSERLPIWHVTYHRNSDTWTCSVESSPCMTCGPRECEKLNTCVYYPNGRELIEALSKRLNACNVRYSYHPFYKETPGISKGHGDNCCIISFTVGKYGNEGAKSLAIEFKRRFILELYSDFNNPNEIFTKTLHVLITEELSTLLSTNAFIAKTNDGVTPCHSPEPSVYTKPESNGSRGLLKSAKAPVPRRDEARKPSVKKDDRKIKAKKSFDVCCSFGVDLMSTNGDVKLNNLLSVNVQLTRMCRVLGVCLLSLWISGGIPRIDFCEDHLCWMVNWVDCAGQRRVMYHKLESFINLKSLMNMIGKFDGQWLEAIELHNQMTYNEDVTEGAKRFVQVSRAFEVVFSSLYAIQKILFDGMVASFAMSIRTAMDAQHEFQLITRLYKIYKHLETSKDDNKHIISRCFTFYDSVLFPYGSLHDEGTPPLSDCE